MKELSDILFLMKKRIFGKILLTPTAVLGKMNQVNPFFLSR
jgi:hypothetical protein